MRFVTNRGPGGRPLPSSSTDHETAPSGAAIVADWSPTARKCTDFVRFVTNRGTQGTPATDLADETQDRTFEGERAADSDHPRRCLGKSRHGRRRAVPVAAVPAVLAGPGCLGVRQLHHPARPADAGGADTPRLGDPGRLAELGSLVAVPGRRRRGRRAGRPPRPAPDHDHHGPRPSGPVGDHPAPVVVGPAVVPGTPGDRDGVRDRRGDQRCGCDVVPSSPGGTPASPAGACARRRC